MNELLAELERLRAEVLITYENALDPLKLACLVREASRLSSDAAWEMVHGDQRGFVRAIDAAIERAKGEAERRER